MKRIFFRFFKKELIPLYLIIIIGAFLRLQGVFTNSFGFTYGVGKDMLTLWDIIHVHKIPLIGLEEAPGVFDGPWWYYFLTPFFIFSSGNPQGIAFVMALVGIFSIILGYILGKRIGGYPLGIILATLISVSQIMVSFSSQISSIDLISLFTILLLFVLERIYLSNKNKLKYYFLLGAILAFIIDFEIIFGLLFALAIILSIVIIDRKKVSIMKLFLIFIGALIITLPKIIFDLRHQFLVIKSLIMFIAKGNPLYYMPSFYSLVANRLEVFFSQFSYTLAAGNALLGSFILLSFVFFYRNLSIGINKFTKTSIIIILTIFVGAIFFPHDIWQNLLATLPIFYILLFSFCIFQIRKVTSSNFGYILLTIVFIVSISPSRLIQSFVGPLWEGDAAVYRNQLAVVNYVYENANGRSFKYVVYTPPVYDYTYQYLFKWYGEDKFKYVPSVQANLAYFILEPDLQVPSRPVEWLKQREGDGKIIESKVVRGGIVVQTRVH